MRTKIQERSEILFKTNNASLYQSDETEQYILSYHDEVLYFRACELISFRRKLQKVDLAMLLSSDTPDIEIVSMPHCDRIFALSVFEILELKELLAGAFAMLELNSLIHREVIRKMY